MTQHHRPKHFYALDTSGITPVVVSFDSSGLRKREMEKEGSQLDIITRQEAMRYSQICVDYFTKEPTVILWGEEKYLAEQNQ